MSMFKGPAILTTGSVITGATSITATDMTVNNDLIVTDDVIITDDLSAVLGLVDNRSLGMFRILNSTKYYHLFLVVIYLVLLNHLL